MKRATPVREAVLKALAERGPMTTPEVAQTVRAESTTVSSALRRLLAEGVVQVKRGKCSAVKFGSPIRSANTWRIKPTTSANVASPGVANAEKISA